MKVLSGRTQRQSRRSLAELGADGRIRLRRLVGNAHLAVIPTSDVIRRVDARLAPGTVGLVVECPPALGIDQTIAVSEVLAAKGFDVTPTLGAGQVRTARHLDGILDKLSRKAIDRVLVEPGSSGSVEEINACTRFLGEMSEHVNAPNHVGIVGFPDGHAVLDREQLAASLMECAGFASFVSTRVCLGVGRVLGWVAEMRVRGLELPIEIGIPGVVPLDALARAVPSLPGSMSDRRTGLFDPTAFAVELAHDHGIERLDISGFRVDTYNSIGSTADWRQKIYDQAAAARAR